MQSEFCCGTDTEFMAGSPDPFFHCHEILPERFIRARREELGEIGTVNESVTSSSETNLLRRFGGKVTGSRSMSATCSKSVPEIIFPSQIRRMIASRPYQRWDFSAFPLR
jgi:hypothetical protein